LARDLCLCVVTDNTQRPKSSGGATVDWDLNPQRARP
jgi:hypothetical protein